MSDVLSLEVAKRLPDFTLEMGFSVGREIVVLFGPSGAGKTMLLRLIAGLERPERGEIRLGERVLVSTRSRVWVPPQGRRAGFVFHDWALFPHLDVRRNLLYGARRGAASEPRMKRLVESFGIGALLGRYPAELSGGERQRVALARALMSEPAMLLLDEPFSALDLATRRAVYRELMSVHAEWQIPLLLVTHDRDEAELLGDRIVFIDRGRQVEEPTSA
jgi:molybdate transport system ATP-binding protein